MLNKQRLYKIVFESDTKAGKRFDIALIVVILLSVFVVMLDSIPGLLAEYFNFFLILEWGFTILFSIEYVLRIYISKKPMKYVTGFWGVIDLLAILPTFLSPFFYGAQYFLIIRILRLLRVFRVMRLYRFSSEALTLLRALKTSSRKILIFLSVVMTVVVVLGTVMYVVEGEENGYTSIPQSIYWAIITVSTVGYGDIVPQTTLGKIISSVAMIIGYSIIAVPTGIFTVEISRASDIRRKCPECGNNALVSGNFCGKCGKNLAEIDLNID